MLHLIKEVVRGKRGARDLNYEEALKVAQFITSGEATDAQIAAFLIGERLKEETSDELLALVKEFSSHTEKIPLAGSDENTRIDFAGPYSGRNSFLATIVVSILMAERGVPVFLHSSDPLPPKYGTTVKLALRELGINVDGDANFVGQSLDELHIGYANSEQFSQPLARIRNVREEIGVRTAFNTVEKLLNISQAKNLMLGSFHRTAINKMIPIFQHLPYETVYIVQGIEGSEDLPLHRGSYIFRMTKDEVTSEIIDPKDFGLQKDKEQFIEKLTVEEQAVLIKSILNNDQTTSLQYHCDQVLLNAGLRYYLFGYESTIEAGIEYAREQITSGKAKQHFEKWIQFSTNK